MINPGLRFCGAHEGRQSSIIQNAVRACAYLTVFGACVLWSAVPLVTRTNFFFPAENFVGLSPCCGWCAPRRAERELGWVAEFSTLVAGLSFWGRNIFMAVTSGAWVLARGDTLLVMYKMLPAEIVPVFDGDGSSFLDFERRVRSCTRITKMEPSKRAAVLALQMNSTDRHVC